MFNPCGLLSSAIVVSQALEGGDLLDAVNEEGEGNNGSSVHGFLHNAIRKRMLQRDAIAKLAPTKSGRNNPYSYHEASIDNHERRKSFLMQGVDLPLAQDFEEGDNSQQRTGQVAEVGVQCDCALFNSDSITAAVPAAAPVKGKSMMGYPLRKGQVTGEDSRTLRLQQLERERREKIEGVLRSQDMFLDDDEASGLPLKYLRAVESKVLQRYQQSALPPTQHGRYGESPANMNMNALQALLYVDVKDRNGREKSAKQGSFAPTHTYPAKPPQHEKQSGLRAYLAHYHEQKPIAAPMPQLQASPETISRRRSASMPQFSLPMQESDSEEDDDEEGKGDEMIAPGLVASALLARGRQSSSVFERGSLRDRRSISTHDNSKHSGSSYAEGRAAGEQPRPHSAFPLAATPAAPPPNANKAPVSAAQARAIRRAFEQVDDRAASSARRTSSSFGSGHILGNRS